MLTERQMEYVVFVAKNTRYTEDGFSISPTLGEIAAFFAVHHSTAQTIINSLIKKGYLMRGDHAFTRNLVVTDKVAAP
jgi:DNA-binding MarR family transcriptional regulator